MRSKAGLVSRPFGVNSGWVLRTAAAVQGWNSVCYGDGLFAAVSAGSTGQVMTSPDGINWTLQTTPLGGLVIAFGGGMYVAASQFGVMYSPDAVNWTTAATAPSGVWRAIAYDGAQFVAVSTSGTAELMTSPDGINWTARTTLGDGAGRRRWRDVVYANGTWVAVADWAPSSGFAPKIMTSTDGINWTGRSVPSGIPSAAGFAPGEFPGWYAVAFGNGRFVAGSFTGGGTITSTDGITWEISNPVYKAPGMIVDWEDIAFGDGTFVGFVYSSNEGIVTSKDGISWTYQAAPQESDWRSLCFGGGKFVAVSFNGDRRVMTSL